MSVVKAEFLKVDAKKMKDAERAARSRGNEQLADQLNVYAAELYEWAQREQEKDNLWRSE